MPTTTAPLLVATLLALTTVAAGQQPPGSAASSSLLERALGRAGTATPASTSAWSMIHVPEPGPRDFAKHDLVEVIVRETSRARSKHELETEKGYDVDGAITAWPSFDLVDMLNLQLAAGRTNNLPRLDMNLGKQFEGEGEYERQDDLTARLTAEVIEVLPNGNLVLEARTTIRTDEEEATMRMTGICRSQDVSPANTVLSSQVHDLKFEKVHSGELKNANTRGVITKVLDFFFAW